MPYIQDSTQSFTISLTALLEGFGKIYKIWVDNNTQVASYTYLVSTATWTPSPPQAMESDSMWVGVTVENTGATADMLFCEFSSAQVTPPEATTQESGIVSVAGSWDVTPGWTFIMPPNAVNITINAGHVE